MNDINKPNGDNLGGIIRFNFIPVDDVESIDIPVIGAVTTPVILKPFTRWYEGYATMGTISFTETPAENMNGTIFNKTFSAFVPKDTPDLIDLFNQMRNRKFLLDYTDSNLNRKLVGSLISPLKFSSSLNTQQDIPGRNGHTISFYGDGDHKAYTYNI